MFDREVISAINHSYFDRVGLLRERDKEVVDAMENYRLVLDGLGLAQAGREALGEELDSLLAAAGTLSYYMGIQDGAALMGALKDGDFTENMLSASGSLLPAVEGENND